MIYGTGELTRELKKTEDAFVTVRVNEREYVIDHIQREPNYEECASSHVVLVCRDGGDGYLRR